MLDTPDTEPLIAFDNSYARLPERFFVRQSPTPVAAPRLIRINEEFGPRCAALTQIMRQIMPPAKALRRFAFE